MAESIAQRNTITCNATFDDCDMGRNWRLTLGILTVMAESIMQQNTISCHATTSDGDTGRVWQLR